MDDHDKIQSFGDIVSATEKLTAPWRRAFEWTLLATVLTNLFWAVIVWFLVHYAYMTPTDVYQINTSTTKCKRSLIIKAVRIIFLPSRMRNNNGIPNAKSAHRRTARRETQKAA